MTQSDRIFQAGVTIIAAVLFVVAMVILITATAGFFKLIAFAWAEVLLA